MTELARLCMQRNRGVAVSQSAIQSQQTVMAAGGKKETRSGRFGSFLGHPAGAIHQGDPVKTTLDHTKPKSPPPFPPLDCYRYPIFYFFQILSF
jgi:hypothetical protein